MKIGSPFPDVLRRIESQAQYARDYVASAQHISFCVSDSRPELVLDDGHGARRFGMTDLVHDQLADIAGVPLPYYRRMRAEAPELLEQNLNTWLRRSGQRHLVRSIHGGAPTVRALLSDRFRPLDHGALMSAILPVLRAHGVTIASSELTDRRLYIKALNQRVTGEVKPGEMVMAGIAISNSEVGQGALTIQPLIYTVRCTNGMITEDLSMRRHHVGKRLGGKDDAIQHLFSDETRCADDRAFFLRVRDVTRATLDEAVFRQQLGKLQIAAGQSIASEHIERIVEVTAHRYHLSDEEGAGILAHLRSGGDHTRWGLCSAITRHAQDIQDYDRASDLERIGALVVEAPSSAWSHLVGTN